MRMVIVIPVTLGLIATVAIVGWLAVMFARGALKRRRMRNLRERQATARLRALERELAPPRRLTFWKKG
jgi:hypothetical protein